IYKSLNCGYGSKDSKRNVKKNLEIVSKKIKVSKNNLLLMYQTHSNKVIVIDNKNKNLNKFKSDAIITKIKGLALAVVTADCVPIILFDLNNKIIGCVHAGWKGAVSGIIENTIKKFKRLNSKNKIYATIGPCIGKRSYEVDIKFFRKFILKSKKNKIYFFDKKPNKKLFNLRKYVHDKLKKLNVKVDHVDKDTFKEKNGFFSYRRSQKLGHNDYGRCISVITLTKFSQI
ncbi:peptidoglycan editing factor PgeF, partial [Pelagibacteraceae bacterium]|nr:peptidoglycan editing factor PgeF [Pelagibacteraceae bacterium]